MLWSSKVDNTRAKKDPATLTTTAYSFLFSQPFDTVLIMLVLGGWCVAFGAGSKMLSIASLSAVFVADYLSFSMVNEVIATNAPASSANFLLAQGQALNMAAYMVMGYLGPVLHGVSTSLPFTVTGFVMLCWGAVLWIVLYNRAVTLLSLGAPPSAASLSTSSEASPTDSSVTARA